MKKYLLFLLPISLVISFSVQDSFATNTEWSYPVTVADSIIVISPIPELDSGSHGPRAPMVVPISASYDSMLSSVILSFTSNLGEIEVEVLNTTTGGYVSDFVDTQFIYATIPITMGPGHYILLFTLPSGQRYRGEFDL